MKKVLTKVWQFIKKIILFILKNFFKIEPQKKNIRTQTKTIKNEEIKKILKEQPKKEMEKQAFKETDDAESDSTRELFKESIYKKEYSINKEIIENEFYKLIEKIFKIKIKDLPTPQKKKLQDYTSKKLIVKVEEKITQNNLITTEELKTILKDQLKKDIEKKGYNFEKLVEEPNLYQPEEPFSLESKPEENKILIINPTKLKQDISPLIKDLSEKKVDEIKNGFKIEPIFEKLEPNIEILSPIQTIQEDIKNQEIKKEAIIENKDELTHQTQIIEKENKLESKPNLIQKQVEQSKPSEKEKVNEKQEKIVQKEEQPQKIRIDILKLEQENNKIIEKAKEEYQKEDIVDKEYEMIENIIEEKIIKLEDLLEKPLSDEQRIKITKELDKLKTMQEEVDSHKKSDIEELRLSLEETIPIDEIEYINQKLKKFTNEEELVYKSLENKSKQELEKLEQIIIKDSFKKTSKMLEIPLYLSFPFIKNKYFRKFVGGLFIFRSFTMIKNLIFGVRNPYADIDLLSIQRGSDALTKSISITENNIASFQELKEAILLKYPQLQYDIDFMNDLNTTEENLYKNYEKLLKKDKVVKKYFNKSKILIRKRKKDLT